MKRYTNQYDKQWQKILHLVTKKIQTFYTTPREHKLFLFFVWLVSILVIRLFYLQVIQWSYYRQELSQQHSSKVNITPKRWGIYVTDDAWQSIALAINWDIYNLYVDPKFVWDKDRVAAILTPELYQHFCDIYWLKKVTKEECITNIEDFTKSTILPRKKILYYSFDEIGTWAWITWLVEAQVTIDQENIDITEQRETIISSFTQQEWESRINEKLKDLLTAWKKNKNYLWFFDSPALLDALSWSNLPYISIENDYYVYVLPNTARNIDKEANLLREILSTHWYAYTVESLRPLFQQQDTRYVKITDWINATIAQKIMRAKNENYKIQNECTTTNTSSCEAWIPLLHW